ncbi:transcription factor Opi1-domain-containing protein [Chytriomyces sp. MP71]|nr:transcription factor Opi1-domain-containing protein [Chytriomyces sp. MP71]
MAKSEKEMENQRTFGEYRSLHCPTTPDNTASIESCETAEKEDARQLIARIHTADCAHNSLIKCTRRRTVPGILLTACAFLTVCAVIVTTTIVYLGFGQTSAARSAPDANRGFAFAAAVSDPKTVSVSVGVGATETNMSLTAVSISVGDTEKSLHDCAAEANALFESKDLFPGNSYSYLFTDAGSYYFYVDSPLNECVTNGAEGVITVSKAVEPSPSPSAGSSSQGSGQGNDTTNANQNDNHSNDMANGNATAIVHANNVGATGTMAAGKATGTARAFSSHVEIAATTTIAAAATKAGNNGGGVQVATTLPIAPVAGDSNGLGLSNGSPVPKASFVGVSAGTSFADGDMIVGWVGAGVAVAVASFYAGRSSWRKRGGPFFESPLWHGEGESAKETHMATTTTTASPPAPSSSSSSFREAQRKADESFFAFASPKQLRVANAHPPPVSATPSPVEADAPTAATTGATATASTHAPATAIGAAAETVSSLSALSSSISHFSSLLSYSSLPAAVPAPSAPASNVATGTTAAATISSTTAENKKRSLDADTLDYSEHVLRRRSVLNHDEQIAAEALEPAKENASHTHHFIDRLSNIPLVRGSLSTFSSAYEATKNASYVMKYSAETVENGIMNISKTLEPALAPLDRFACNQLDKLEHNFPNMINTQQQPSSATESNVDPMEDNRSDSSHPTTASMSHGTFADEHQREGSIRSTDGDPMPYGHLPQPHTNHHVTFTYPSKPPNDDYPIKDYSLYHQQQHPGIHLPVQQGYYPSTAHLSSNPATVYPAFPPHHAQRQRSSSVSSNVSSVSSTSSVSTIGYESVASGYTQYGQEYSQALSHLSAPPSRAELSGEHMEEVQQQQQQQQQREQGSMQASGAGAALSTAPMIARKPRGMWGSVVQGVQSNLGAMVISEDAVRALKWCLKILQEAARNIEVQVDLLRRYLASYLANFNLPGIGDSGTHNASNSTTPPISPQDDAAINNDLNTAISSVTREVVGTLKLVVEMLVKHASSRLPPPARRRVREFILRLPNRWSSLANDLQTPASGIVSPQGGRAAAAAGAGSDSNSASTSGATGVNSPLPTEAQRVLTLAAESSAMLKNVMNVFSQTVSGAEAVLGRTVDDEVGLPSMEGLRISKDELSPVEGGLGPRVAGVPVAGPVLPPHLQVPQVGLSLRNAPSVQMDLDLD